MKTALLVCDHIADDFKEIHGDYVAMFNNLLPDVVMEPFFVIDNEFPEIEKYDVFICTGSRYSVYDDLPWVEQLKEMTKEIYNLGKKFIGICFGHQLIAESLGGKVEKQDGGYLIGLHNFAITKNLSWMKPQVEGYKVLMLCQDQITVLPEKSLVLSKSADCPIGMYTVGKNFLGIQGHPEFSREYNRAIFESRADRINADKIEKAFRSLEFEPSNLLLANYLERFILD